MADYPSSIFSPTNPGIGDTLSITDHWTVPTDEIVAIQTTLGVNPTPSGHASLAAFFSAMVTAHRRANPIGMQLDYSFPTLPAGFTDFWIECTGQTLNKADWPDLWSYIDAGIDAGTLSTPWARTDDPGGTFTLPDFRNRFARVNPSAGRVLGSNQDDAVIDHHHNMFVNSDGTANVAAFFRPRSSFRNYGRRRGPGIFHEDSFRLCKCRTHEPAAQLVWNRADIIDRDPPAKLLNPPVHSR